MSAELPDIGRADFAAALQRLSPQGLDDTAVERLWIHYTELARWNRRLSLVGPGTANEVLRRHYGESLAALPLLAAEDRSLVDIGSGAGFPGFVLAAARPDLETTLVESRRRKWSFLSLVCEKTALPCHCLDARVSAAIPDGFPRQMDVVTTRAVRFSDAEIAALAGRLTADGRFLVWMGARPQPSLSTLRQGRQIALGESRERRIVELFPALESWS